MTILIDSGVIVQRLMAAKDHRGYSQTDLAKLSGVPQPHISRLAKGLVKDPSVNTILELCQALEIDLPALFDNDTEVFLQALQAENSDQVTLPSNASSVFVEVDDIPVFLNKRFNTSNVFIEMTPRNKQDSAGQTTTKDVNAFMKLAQIACVTKVIIADDKQPVAVLSLDCTLQNQLIEAARQWADTLNQQEVQWSFLDVEQAQNFMAKHHVQLSSSTPDCFDVKQDYVTTNGQFSTALNIESMPYLLQDHWKQMLCLPGVTQVWRTEVSNVTHVIRHLRKEIGELEMQLEHYYNRDLAKTTVKENRLHDLLTLLHALETATTTMHDVSGTLIVTGDSLEQLQGRVEAVLQRNQELPQTKSIAFKQAHKSKNLQKITSALFGNNKPQQIRFHAQAVATLCPWLCLDDDFDDEASQVKSLPVR